MDPIDIAKMFQQVLDNYQQNGNLSSTNRASEVYDLLRDMVEDMTEITEEEMKKFGKRMLEDHRLLFGNSQDLTTVRKLFMTTLEDFSKKVQINAELLANLETAFESLEIQTSQLYEEMKDKTGKGVGHHALNLQGSQYRGSIQAQERVKELGRPEQSLDTFRDKMFAFFRGIYDKSKVDMKHFGEDLIEGMAKSKFIGGAFMDLIKLASYFLGGFFKQFGPLGKALAVGIVAVAPVIGSIFVGLFANMLKVLLWDVVVKGSFNLMGNLLKSLLNPANFAKALSALRGIGSGIGQIGGRIGGALGGTSLMRLGAAGALVGASAWGISQAVDSFKKGGARENTAGGFLAAGGVTALAAAIGVAVGAAFAPVTALVAGIALAIGSIIKWWPQIQEGFKGIKEKFDILTSGDNLLSSFWDWLKSLKIFGGDGGSTYTQGGEIAVTSSVGQKFGNVFAGKSSSATSAQMLQGKWKGGGNRHLDPTKFTEQDWQKADTLDPIYGEMGEIINLSQMSQKRASEVIAADIAKKRDKSYYELVGNDLADWKQFGTDARAADGSGVYMARGFSNQFRSFLSDAEAAGYDTTGIKITSGIGTLGSRGNMSPHTYTDSAYGHFGSNALTFDIGRLVNRQTGKSMTAEDAAKLGYSGMYFYNEGDHEHISFGQWQSQLNRKVNYKDFAESAQQHLAFAERKLKEEETEADKDGNRTKEEQERIDKIKKFRDEAKADVDEIKKYNPTSNAQTWDWTGNLLSNYKLQNTLNQSWLQSHQY